MLIGLFVILLITGAVIPLLVWWRRAVPTCPSCANTAVSEMSKEQTGTPVIHGGRVSATIHYEYRYYCKRCDTRWDAVKVESR